MLEVRGDKWRVGSGKKRQGNKEKKNPSLLVSPSSCPLAPPSPCLLVSSSHSPLPIPHSLPALFALFALFASALAQDRPMSPPLTGRETPPASSPISSKAEATGDRSFRLTLPPMPGAGPKSGRV